MLIKRPKGNTPRSVSCIICDSSVPQADATPGALYVDGQQAFACRKHMRDRTAWVRAWAEFRLRENNDVVPRWYFEQGATTGAQSMATAIVRHAAQRLRVGSVVVVLPASAAVGSLGAYHRHARQLLRELAREQAATLDARIRGVLGEEIGLISSAFRLSGTIDSGPAVHYQTPNDISLPKNCHTLYLTTEVPPLNLAQLVADLQEPGLVVTYVPLDFDSLRHEASVCRKAAKLIES